MRFADLASDAKAACKSAGGIVQMQVCIANYVKAKTQAALATNSATPTTGGSNAIVSDVGAGGDDSGSSMLLVLGGLAVVGLGAFYVIRKRRRSMAGYRRRR